MNLANGEGYWAAQKELERRMNAVESKQAVHDSQMLDLKDDLNGIGRKIDNMASKDDVMGIEKRLDRARNSVIVVATIAVPAVSALVGAVIRGGA